MDRERFSSQHRRYVLYLRAIALDAVVDLLCP